MSKPMVYGMETTGFQHSWHTVRLTANASAISQWRSDGAALFRWKRIDGDGEDRYNMEWYGVSRGVGDWYQGDSDRNMTDEFFYARWDVIEDCLDGPAYGMSATDIRAALSAYLIPEDEA